MGKMGLLPDQKFRELALQEGNGRRSNSNDFNEYVMDSLEYIMNSLDSLHRKVDTITASQLAVQETLVCPIIFDSDVVAKYDFGCRRTYGNLMIELSNDQN